MSLPCTHINTGHMMNEDQELQLGKRPPNRTVQSLLSLGVLIVEFLVVLAWESSRCTICRFKSVILS